MDGTSFNDLCEILGKDHLSVRNLQRGLNLHIPPKNLPYSDAYLAFLQKVVWLMAFHVPFEEIRDLFETEQKILQLFHADTLTQSPTWYLDSCTAEANFDPESGVLLLSGYPLGSPIDGSAVQGHLDFSEQRSELFKGSEMGEDVRRVLKKYTRQIEGIEGRVRRQLPITEDALEWTRRVFRRRSPHPDRGGPPHGTRSRTAG